METNAPNLTETTYWSSDPDHCNVRFNAKHILLSEVEGAFLKFQGAMEGPYGQFDKMKISFQIDTESIKTSNPIRDMNLRSSNFLDVEAFPKILFESSKITKVLGNQYLMDGELTIKSITNTVQLDVWFNGFGTDLKGNSKLGFKVEGTLNRFDYRVDFNVVTATLIDVGMMVSFRCNIEMFKVDAKNTIIQPIS